MSEQPEKKKFEIPQRTYYVELMVGVFMLFGVGCFSFIAINIAQMRFFETGHHRIKAQFTNISGLENGAPVEIAGVPIGEVTNIKLEGTSAVVTMTIRDSVDIREDDIASIRTKGIIGDRYVRINPGASDKMVPADGEITDTESTVDIEEIIGKVIHRMENSDK